MSVALRWASDRILKLMISSSLACLHWPDVPHHGSVNSTAVIRVVVPGRAWRCQQLWAHDALVQHGL